MTNYIGKLNGLPESRQLKKDYKKLSKYLIKKLEYEEKEEICRNRNSYYKTYQDATAMCLKEDYLLISHKKSYIIILMVVN